MDGDERDSERQRRATPPALTLEEETERIRMYQSQPDLVKYTVSTVPARKIQIGNWQRTTDNDNEILAKFFFRIESIAWEIVDDNETKRIEMFWNNISSLRMISFEGNSILKVELEAPPEFFTEIDPQPRRHRQWMKIPDFTNGEAERCRIHTVTFPEGVLESHYDKLTHIDDLLFHKSRGPFPVHNYPFFSQPHQASTSSYANGGWFPPGRRF
ncbi:uncharacterized protein LOC109843092 [Asparagus officinalis]|uniref:uncharacterized protein LOC109843092 n=1 Tax=Asparagus officinalis TaxID=4686 RepID=UPI00098E86CF|nr:uncharacterized protein LOC109843092 [Asparagus officinalis]